jgi:hypothetical protein
MTTAAGSPPLRRLEIESRSGSRQHFYHFMLGVLVPLCRYLALTGEQDLPLILRDCGPMNDILYELDLPQMLLAETGSFTRLAETLPPEILRRVTIPGLDIGKRTEPAYEAEAVMAGARGLVARWQDRIDKIHADLVAKWPQRPRLMVIERGPPHPFFAQARSHVRTSGAGRRSIANHAQMVTEIARRNPGTRNIRLEGLPLATQIALFRAADVVVAQHGAALSNILWMRADAAIVEIDGVARSAPYFIDLARIVGAGHRLVAQAGENGPVELGGLVAAVHDATSRLRLVS